MFCPWCCYTLEDLRHCPIIGQGQEVRVAVLCALHSDWTACLCQRRVPQSNAPWRNKTHSVGSHVYLSNVRAKLIMRADYRLYIVRWRPSLNMLYVHRKVPRFPKKNCIFLYSWSFTTAFYQGFTPMCAWSISIVVTMIYIAVVPLLTSYILIARYHVHVWIYLCQSCHFYVSIGNNIVLSFKSFFF